MLYFLYYPHKAGNLKLYRLVVLFRGGEEPRKNKDWLDHIGRWPTSLRDSLAGGSMKDNGSKAELFGGV